MNWKSFKIFFLSILIACACFPLKAQQLNIKTFSIEDGLPQSQILNIFQDHTGVIWIGTNGGGVSRYDGIKFNNLSSKDGLSNNRVYSVLEDSHQNVWIGTGKGLNKYENNKLYKVSDTLLNQQIIYRIYEHSNGELWLGTNNGIVIYDGKKFKPFIRNDSIGNHQVWAIKEDHKGNTWICALFKGVFCYDGKKIIHYGINDGLNDLKNRDILINGDELWVTTYLGVNVWDLSKPVTGGQKFKKLLINGKPFSGATFYFLKDAGGSIWIGNNSGVYKITNKKARLISKNNGLSNNLIQSIVQDTEGNMWFGSFTGGVSKYRNDLFVNINEQQGLINNTVMSFYKDSKNRMWIGTWSGGVSMLDYNSWQNKDTVIIQNYESKNGRSLYNIWSITEDKKGNTWFGTSGSGITIYDGKIFNLYHLKDGLHGIRIHDLVKDKYENIWVAHENGVDKYDGKTFSFYGQEQGFSAQGVNAIYKDKFDNLWFGSTDKIMKYDGKTFSNITRPEGFPRIRNIIADKYGNMWFSTDAGVSVYNGKTFKSINENDGLSSNTVYFVKTDNEGNLWMGTNNGIDKFNLDKFIKQNKIEIKHYGKEEGFIGSECNQNAFYKDEDGKLWIGTIGGVTIYDPKQEKINLVEPQTRITNIRLFFEHVDFSKYSDSTQNGLPENLKLPYDKNHITFDFIGICQTIPQKVNYQFMLQGFDTDWLPQGKASSTTYSNLSPGIYTFLLKASNNDGLWNKKPVRFTFEIIPPFWKRTWFISISALAVVFSIFTFIKMRERNLIHSQKLLEKQVAIRTRELFEEKEKLQIAYSDIDVKNKEITDSIQYAKRIQQAILASDTLLKKSLQEYFVLYKPKDIVSGDFYWAVQTLSASQKEAEKHFLICAGDCTGHGVPGAFMSLLNISKLNETVNEKKIIRPDLILNQVREEIIKALNPEGTEVESKDGMDCVLCAFDFTAMKLQFANSNNPLWMIRKKELNEVKGDKMPVGMHQGEQRPFKLKTADLQKGDCIYIFTDGFADQFGGKKGKKFMYKQLKQILLENHQKTMQEQKHLLETTMENWRGHLEQVDDILIIGIRI